MAAPIAKTFQTLTTTANPFAGEVLIAALDVPVAGIQIEAVRSIIERGGVREQMEAIRRYPSLPEDVRLEFETRTAALVPAIRQCLLVGRGDLEFAALDLARTGEAYGTMETLLNVLRGERTDLYEEVVHTLRHLVNRLYEHLHVPKGDDSPPLKNAVQIQHMVMSAFDQALSYYHELSHPDEVVESILAIGGPGHFVTEKLLQRSSLECRALANELLHTSRHPGVMRFLLDSLAKPYPSPRIVDALQTREDPEFLLAMLRWVPSRWTGTQERNLKQLESMASLNEDALEWIPDELQTPLMTLVSATGLSREDKAQIRQWIVRHGCPEARNAAVDVLQDLDTETVQEIVLDGLDSEDPNVQAWATSQLRSQHVPDALNKLIERLDSPEATVQNVARQELQGFDLECLLSHYESMAPQARKNAGKLLQKIDPDYVSHLNREMHHSIRRRRIRAIRGTLAYGWHLQLVPTLLEMLQDDDSLIRRTTVEVLEHIKTPEVLAALIALKDDPSERVRETVDKALEKISAEESEKPVDPVPTKS